MLNLIISRCVIVVFGVLYPAYSSYKALNAKNTRNIVTWMMYWIIFAIFTAIECLTDILLSWLPFYYELKILFLIWLLSPATKGTTFLYRHFVHPQLMKHEEEIDENISKASQKGCETLINVGAKGIHIATNTMLKTALQVHGMINEQYRKKSYSLSDIHENLENVKNSPRQTRILTKRATLNIVPETELEGDTQASSSGGESSKKESNILRHIRRFEKF